jgi:hypothetical protein
VNVSDSKVVCFSYKAGDVEALGRSLSIRPSALSHRHSFSLTWMMDTIA